MKLFWTLAKVVLVLALAIPVSLFVFGAAVTALGALIGLAVLALRVVFIGLIIYGAFKIGTWIFGGRKTPAPPKELPALPPRDPYYEAAMRELDQDIRVSR